MIKAHGGSGVFSATKFAVGKKLRFGGQTPPHLPSRGGASVTRGPRRLPSGAMRLRPEARPRGALAAAAAAEQTLLKQKRARAREAGSPCATLSGARGSLVLTGVAGAEGDQVVGAPEPLRRAWPGLAQAEAASRARGGGPAGLPAGEGPPALSQRSCWRCLWGDGLALVLLTARSEDALALAAGVSPPGLGRVAQTHRGDGGAGRPGTR